MKHTHGRTTKIRIALGSRIRANQPLELPYSYNSHYVRNLAHEGKTPKSIILTRTRAKNTKAGVFASMVSRGLLSLVRR